MDPLRGRLRAEATHQFTERGFDGTSIREIADACGVTKAALYYHYPSKSALLLDVVEAYLDDVAAVVATAREAEAGAPDQLRGIVRGLFALPGESRAVMRLALHDLRHLDDSARTAFAQRYHERFLSPLAEVVGAGMDAGDFARRDPLRIVWMLLGMLYPFFSGHDAGLGTDRDAEELLEVLLAGLAAGR